SFCKLLEWNWRFWNATASEVCSRSFGRIAAGCIRRIRAPLGGRPIRHVEAGYVEGDHLQGELDESPYLRFSRRERSGRKLDAMGFGNAADGDDAQGRFEQGIHDGFSR